MEIVDVSALAIDRATELRVRYAFKTPDAILLACAIVAGVDVFVTGDASLARCTELPIELVSPTP